MDADVRKGKVELGKAEVDVEEKNGGGCEEGGEK